MANSPHSFVLVYEDDQSHVQGFVCCATNTSKMYRSVMLSRFPRLSLAVLGKIIFHPSILVDMLPSIRRPKTFLKEAKSANWVLPETEIVSIGVSPDAQGMGIGTKLINAAFERLKQMGSDRVRVWTSDDNEQAKQFYQAKGFTVLGKRQHHSGGIWVFVADINKPVSEAICQASDSG